MTLARTYPAGWGVGEKLTSAQQNALDINVTNALDKRVGQTDTLESIVAASGAGRLRRAQATAADADTTYDTDDGQVFRVPSSLTAARAYTIGTASASLAAGDEMLWFCDAALTFRATIQTAGPTTLFRLGNADTDDGSWVLLRYSGTAWQVVSYGQEARQRSELFTASGSWTCPADVSEVLLLGIGGGGGGGGGAAATGSGGAGAGGGGARAAAIRVPVSPGTTYTVTIGGGGGGGAAGTAGAAGSDGSDGGDTSFSDGVTSYSFCGASGGAGGLTNSASEGYVPGGNPVRRAHRGTSLSASNDNLNGPRQEGMGGVGVRNPLWAVSNIGSAVAAVTAGQGSVHEAGAAQGARGVEDADLYAAGCGGGGGGASGWIGNAPGAGGQGGDGSGSGTTTTGRDGTAGTLGAGGGGGGGGGQVNAGSTNGGAGGNGGSGALRVIFVK